jgi:hypothetical protein
MGEINLEAHEVRAIQSVDTAELHRLVQDAVQTETASGLHELRLWDCGEYVGERLRRFEAALAEHAKAKSAAKRERTGSDAHRAGGALVSAVYSMKDRQEKDEKRDQLFRVDDHIRPPYRFSPKLSVTVSFQWRLSVDDDWIYGRIVFTHDVDVSPNYERLHYLGQMGRLPKRKPSVAKQDADQQTELSRSWEYFMRGALYSVRDYLEKNPDGSTIPASHHSSGTLNNYSTQFWRESA